MKNTALLLIVSFLGGCTVSANNHHFELDAYVSKSYDDFSGTWCFAAGSAGEVVMCSSPYKRHSKSIGLIVPVVPQTNRESRLAYDVVTARTVEFKNSGIKENISLAFPAGFELCTDNYTRSCTNVASVAIEPGKSVWVKVPNGATHEIDVTIGKNKFKTLLKEFVDSRWHLVSV